jgi:transcriptional regulator with XRE-family HTH domain
MNINEKIYRNTKALCKINGQSLKEIEQQLGRNPGYLSRKSTKVDVETLMKLCDLLDIAPEQLMNRDYEDKLATKEAFDELKSAVLNLKQHITDDAIKESVEEILSEENTSKEES